jgi:probable HAF family extracellular repeat protein
MNQLHMISPPAYGLMLAIAPWRLLIRLRRSSPVFAVMFVFFCAGTSRSAPLYHVSLIAPPGTLMTPNAINDLGQVVGITGTNRAFLYSNGVMTLLSPAGATSSAEAINANGLAVGYSFVSGGNIRAVEFANGNMTYLGSLAGINGYSWAMGVNNQGLVVGVSGATGADHAFEYSGGAMTDLGNSFGYSSASGINALGQIIGDAAIADGSVHPFLMSGGIMTNLGPILGNGSEVYGINDSGAIVGDAVFGGSGVQHAFLLQGTALTDLGTPGPAFTSSRATGVNNSGVVIGVASGTSSVATVYQGGKMYDLSQVLDSSGAGLTLTQATGINNKGMIVAWGLNSSSREVSVILTPLSVPEPASVTSLIVGLVLGGAALRRLRSKCSVGRNRDLRRPLDGRSQRI